MLRLWKTTCGYTLTVISFLYLIFVLNPIQMSSVFVYPFSPRLCRRINEWCARSIWGWWVLTAEVQNGIEIRFTGDVIRPRENAFVLPNHQCMSDVLLLLCLAWRCGHLGNMKWFAKDILKYIPGPGWGMKLLDCVFLKRNWAQDKAGIQKLFAKYEREQIPIFLVSFLEGTRRTKSKLQKSQAYAKDNGLYVPQHTLVPRTKGFVATVFGLRDHLAAVYDVTLGYPEGEPSLQDCFTGRVKTIEVHIRRHPIAELPESDEALAAWAHARFQEKDERMARFAKEGRFEGPEQLGEVRVRDWFRPERRLDPANQPAQ